MNRKGWLRLGGAASLAATLTLAQAQTTLTWWDYYTDGANNNAVTALIEGYEATNPDVTIERTTIPFGDLKARIIQAAATGTMPDLLIIDNPDHQAIAAQGALADLTDVMADWEGRDLYFEGPWSSTMFEGRNYGVPFGSNATALYYNRTALAEAGADLLLVPSCTVS